MNADWAGVGATTLVAVVAGVWAVIKWSREQEKSREQERERCNALYANPMLFATQDLQSRLYNLLANAGLVPLREGDPSGLYAEETLYLVARYFAWEQTLLRFTHYGTDQDIVRTTEGIREDFATDSLGNDAWRIFRPTQSALGQSIMVWRQGETGFADTITVVDFRKLFTERLGRELRLEGAVESLRSVQSIDELPEATRSRLSAVQRGLVALLELIEKDLSDHRGSKFSVSAQPRAKVGGPPTR